MSPRTASSNVVLPAPGADIRFTTATDSRSKSARLAWAIVVFASRASSATFTLVRCMPPPLSSTSIDSTRNSSPARTLTSDPPQPGQRKTGWSSVHSCCSHAAQASRASTSSSSSRAPSHTVSRLTMPQ